MDILALVGIGALLRWWRRRAPNRNAPRTPAVSLNPPAPTIRSSRPAAGQRLTLLLRAARALLLAALMLLLALMPWPTAWATSAALAPSVAFYQRAIVAYVDVITVALVSLALLEPLVPSLLGPICRIPRLLALLAQLAVIQLRVSYWRYRNWRIRVA